MMFALDGLHLSVFSGKMALAIVHLGRLKMRDMKMRHKEKCRAGKCRTGKYGTRNPGLENARKVSMESEQMLYIDHKIYQRLLAQ